MTHALLLAGATACSSSDHATPDTSVSASSASATTSLHPLEDALMAAGFTPKEFKVAEDGNSAVITLPNLCPIEAVMSMDGYRVISIGGRALTDFSPGNVAPLNTPNQRSGAVWAAVADAQGEAKLTC